MTTWSRFPVEVAGDLGVCDRLLQLQAVEELPHCGVRAGYEGFEAVVPALGDVGRPGKTTENSVVVVPGPGVEGGGLGGGPHPGVLCGEVHHVGVDGRLEETPRKDQVVLLEVHPQGLLKMEVAAPDGG